MANNFFRIPAARRALSQQLSNAAMAFFGRVIPKPRWGGTTPATPFPPKPVSTPGTTPATPFPPKPVSTAGTTPATPFPPKVVSTPFPPKPVSTPDPMAVVDLLHFFSSVITIATFLLGLGLFVQGKGEKEDKLKQAKAEIIAEVQKVRVDIAELKNNLKKPNKWFWFW